MKPILYLLCVTIAALVSIAATVPGLSPSTSRNPAGLDHSPKGSSPASATAATGPVASASGTSFSGSAIQDDSMRANDPSRVPLIQTPQNAPTGIAALPEKAPNEPNQGITKTWDDRFRQNPTADSDAEEVRERARGAAE